MPEPALPEYLNRAYPDKRGETLIAEDVWDFEEHRKRVLTPDGYRPEEMNTSARSIKWVPPFRQRSFP